MAIRRIPKEEILSMGLNGNWFQEILNYLRVEKELMFLNSGRELSLMHYTRTVCNKLASPL